MKKLEVTLSLGDARKGFWRIDDNPNISENVDFVSSDIFESRLFSEDEIDEMNSLRYSIEDQLRGLEYDIKEVEC